MHVHSRHARGLPHQLGRRDYQDYTNWQNFLRRSQWQEIGIKPTLAAEIITTQMNALGLQNPSEQTSASIAAGIGVATYGEKVRLMSNSDMNFIYQAFKAQLQNFREHHACEACGYNRRK